jgi:FtsZ-binding cell division protein ZapB
MDKMDVLEAKIRKTTDLIRTLREERSIMEAQLKSARDEVRRLSSREEDPQLRGDVDRLTKERRMIAERIEKMIGQIEEIEMTAARAEGV